MASDEQSHRSKRPKRESEMDPKENKYLAHHYEESEGVSLAGFQPDLGEQADTPLRGLMQHETTAEDGRTAVCMAIAAARGPFIEVSGLCVRGR